MSVVIPETERKSIAARLGIAHQVVEACTLNAEIRREFEAHMMDLYNSIGKAYGWKVCPTESGQISLLTER